MSERVTGRDGKRDVAIVAFSFALRKGNQEPNPCNLKLAQEVLRLRKDYPSSLVVAQWEVAKALGRLGHTADHVISRPSDGTYLDTNFVWREACEHLADAEIWQVVPVAQPFLQLTQVRRMIRRSPFALQVRRINRIGFDNSRDNSQWWTKGPVRLLAYALLALTKGLLTRLPNMPYP